MTHPVFVSRRLLLRQMYMREKPPGIEFAFFMARPRPHETSSVMMHEDTNYEALLKWECESFGDVVYLNTMEVDSRAKVWKSYNMFKWAAELGKGRFMYVAKADDDALIHPYLLRLHLSMLPRRDRVYWGRSSGYSTDFVMGPLYILSEDLVHQVAATSYDEWLKKTGRDFGEDIKMGQFVSHLVPESEWFPLLMCELHNVVKKRPHHGKKLEPWEHEITNMTIVAHAVKDPRRLEEAFSIMLPVMEDMKHDCKEWQEQGADPQLYGTPPRAEECRRWYRPPHQKCRDEREKGNEKQEQETARAPSGTEGSSLAASASVTGAAAGTVSSSTVT